MLCPKDGKHYLEQIGHDQIVARAVIHYHHKIKECLAIRIHPTQVEEFALDLHFFELLFVYNFK